MFLIKNAYRTWLSETRGQTYRLAILLLVLCAGSLSALTISPELRAKLKGNGDLEQFQSKFSRWQAQLENQQPAFDVQRALAKSAGSAGQITMKVCVLLVDFSDNPSSAGSVPDLTASTVENILFSQGATQYGSMTDFYLQSSYGQFLLDGDVFGWFRLPKTYAQYVGNDNGLQASEPNARTMARDAILAADPTVDFSPYDYDGDGMVDAVIVIHAGPGAEESGAATLIWSHQWNTGGQVFTNDGKRVYKYLTTPEEVFGGALRIGVYAHEFGHILGLPDLYDVGSSPSLPGLGNWSLMAGGNWNNSLRTPAQFDGWCKHVLDSLYGAFGKTINVAANLTNVTLGPVVSDSVRYRLNIGPKEYFIVENRQRVGFDNSLPGYGLTILHCDDNLGGSNNSTAYGHWRISLEQADGELDLENNQNEGDAGDPFPGLSGEHNEWTNLTVPNTDSWYGQPNQVAVWNITQNTDTKTVNCNLDVTYSRANLVAQTCEFTDIVTGNGDQIFDKGETVQVYVSFTNFWKAATGVNVALKCTTPGIAIVAGNQFVANVANGQTVSMPPLSFQISPTISSTNARFDVEITSTNPAGVFTTSYFQVVGGAEILLVDGDDSPAASNRSTYVTTALESLQLPYTYWDIATQGTPGAAETGFKYIIWYTGDKRAQIETVISPAEVSFLRNYLDAGGKLYLSGQDIAELLSSTADSTFLRDYLGARYVSDYFPYEVLGVSGSPIGDNLRLHVVGFNGASNQKDSDILDILPGATHIFDLGSSLSERIGPGGCAFARPNGSRVVFTSFGLESPTTNDEFQGFNTRFDLLQRVLGFLNDNVSTDVDDEDALAILPVAFDLQQNYPNPFNPTTRIAFSVNSRSTGKPLSLDVFNVLGQRVAALLDETARAGTATIEFDGGGLPSGVYFYRLRIGAESVTRKMVLNK